MNNELGLINYTPEKGAFQNPYSEATGALIDGEVRKLVSRLYEETKELLVLH